jgi:outer membrane lipoprotein carrier protein
VGKTVLARSTLLFLVGAGMLLGWRGSSAAQQPQTPAEVARRVDAHYNHLRSMSVHFTETFHGMGMERKERGTLLLAKPGRMRWNYTEPPGKLFLLDGKYAYSYNPGDAQVDRYRARQLDDLRSPLRFLLGHTKLQKELGNLTMTSEGDKLRLKGTPAGMEQQVANVELTVDKDGVIDSMKWQEPNGSVTEFNLLGEQDNPPIPAGTFTFQPPAGVVVVDGMPPI